MPVYVVPETPIEAWREIQITAPGVAFSARRAAITGLMRWTAAEAKLLREKGILNESYVMNEEIRRMVAKDEERRIQLPPKKQIRLTFEENQKALEAAMPAGVNAARLREIAIQAITQNPKLLECWEPSLLGGVLRSAALGLELNTDLGQAYLIPFNNRIRLPGFDRPQYRMEAQFILGYRGMIVLASRSPSISHIKSAVVYRQDQFDFMQGTEDFIRHRPSFKHEAKDSDIVAAYAIAVLVSGEKIFRVIDREEIEERRAASKNTSASGPWNEWFSSMCQKSAVRALFPMLPITGTLLDIARPDAERVELTDTGEILGFATAGEQPKAEIKEPIILKTYREQDQAVAQRQDSADTEKEIVLRAKIFETAIDLIPKCPKIHVLTSDVLPLVRSVDRKHPRRAELLQAYDEKLVELIQAEATAWPVSTEMGDGRRVFVHEGGSLSEDPGPAVPRGGPAAPQRQSKGPKPVDLERKKMANAQAKTKGGAEIYNGPSVQQIETMIEAISSRDDLEDRYAVVLDVISQLPDQFSEHVGRLKGMLEAAVKRAKT